MILAAFIVGLLSVTQNAASPERAPAQRIEGLDGLSNVALVAPGLYRGGMPGKAGIASLSTMGIKTIVSLRHFHHRSEEKAAIKAGIKYVWLPIPSSGVPSPETLRRFLEIVQDREAQPIYVHCYRGKDRTGTMIAAYRVLLQGWPKNEAMAEMKSFGFFDGWVRLRRWVENLPTPGMPAPEEPR